MGQESTQFHTTNIVSSFLTKIKVKKGDIVNLPNGFGSVYKLSGKRRKPYVARKTTGWSFDEDNGKCYPIYQFVGYYATRKEALTALTEYNKDPFDLSTHNLTFAQLYDKWSEELKGKSDSSMNAYKRSFNISAPIHNMKMVDIRIGHLQNILNTCGKNRPILKQVKTLYSLLFEYAVKHEIVEPKRKDMISYLDTNVGENPNQIKREVFTKTEIQTLWDRGCKIPIILLYSGVRIGELLDLKIEDIDLQEKRFCIRKSKTSSGIREVPIADKILPIIAEFVEASTNGYLLQSKTGRKFESGIFRECYWNPMMKDMGMNHRPHDTRHTCISLLTEVGVDERIIKQIVGHKGQGVTETVYTHIDIATKLEAINRI